METNKKINHLLDRYFAGETSTQEEQKLRVYFAQENLPDEMQPMAPLFGYMNTEAAAWKALREIEREDKKQLTQAKRRRWIIGSATATTAASVIIAVVLLLNPTDAIKHKNENCVWIDGKQIFDTETVLQYAEKSFKNVRIEANIVEEQLRFMAE